MIYVPAAAACSYCLQDRQTRATPALAQVLQPPAVYCYDLATTAPPALLPSGYSGGYGTPATGWLAWANGGMGTVAWPSWGPPVPAPGTFGVSRRVIRSLVRQPQGLFRRDAFTLAVQSALTPATASRARTFSVYWVCPEAACPSGQCPAMSEQRVSLGCVRGADVDRLSGDPLYTAQSVYVDWDIEPHPTVDSLTERTALQLAAVADINAALLRGSTALSSVGVVSAMLVPRWTDSAAYPSPVSPPAVPYPPVTQVAQPLPVPQPAWPAGVTPASATGGVPSVTGSFLCDAACERCDVRSQTYRLGGCYDDPLTGGSWAFSGRGCGDVALRRYALPRCAGADAGAEGVTTDGACRPHSAPSAGRYRRFTCVGGQRDDDDNDGDMDDFPKDWPYIIIIVAVVLCLSCSSVLLFFTMSKRKKDDDHDDAQPERSPRQKQRDASPPPPHEHHDSPRYAPPPPVSGPYHGRDPDGSARGGYPPQGYGDSPRHAAYPPPAGAYSPESGRGSAPDQFGVDPEGPDPWPPGTRAEALHGDQYYPCEMVWRNANGLYTVNWEDGSHSVDIAAEALRPPPTS